MILPIPYVFAGIGLLLVATSIPLALRRVPMNRWYGVRTRKAYVSDENWYAINAFGGKLLFVLGLFMLAVAWVGRDIWPGPRNAFEMLVTLAPLAGIALVLAAIGLYARQLPEQ